VAFGVVGIEDWGPFVTTDRRFLRPAEVDVLIGDASKARNQLGWEPTLDFQTLIKVMVDHDLELEARKARDR
jgi:GDPmannose 4,6-dehydratase